MEIKQKNILSCILGFWIVLGAFLDGSAHIAGEVENFFTPWHAVLYSGWFINALWYGFLYVKNKKQMPEGYYLGLMGALIFFLGGIGDLIWHELFGIEEEVKALLSPTHLVLLIGCVLMVTSPYRNCRAAFMDKPSFLSILPAVFSLALATSITSFFMMYAWVFRITDAEPAMVHFYAQHFSGNHEYSRYMLSIGQMRGIESFIISTLILLAPAFLLIKRWKIPYGTLTLLYTVLGVIMSILDRFYFYEQILALFIVGLFADYMAKNRPLWQFSILVPVVSWMLYFLGMQIKTGIGWDVTSWAGSIVFTALIGFGLYYTMFEKEVG